MIILNWTIDQCQDQHVVPVMFVKFFIHLFTKYIVQKQSEMYIYIYIYGQIKNGDILISNLWSLQSSEIVWYTNIQQSNKNTLNLTQKFNYCSSQNNNHFNISPAQYTVKYKNSSLRTVPSTARAKLSKIYIFYKKSYSNMCFLASFFVGYKWGLGWKLYFFMKSISCKE